jgi:hypothetical protein
VGGQGEFYAPIVYGLKRHRPPSQGFDGKLANEIHRSEDALFGEAHVVRARREVTSTSSSSEKSALTSLRLPTIERGVPDYEAAMSAPVGNHDEGTMATLL